MMREMRGEKVCWVFKDVNDRESERERERGKREENNQAA
jgi:hypothetical protein